MLPRHFRTGQLARCDALVTGRRLLLANGEVRIGFPRAAQTSPPYRDAMADECVFIESGEAILESVFGALRARSGDYVVGRSRPRTAGSSPARCAPS